MKSLATSLLILFCISIHAQDNTLKTESLLIDDFISFVVANFKSSSKDASVSSIQKPQHLTFLIETGTANFSRADEVMLQQGFKLLSNRLHQNDKLSIAIYSGQNGLILNQESPNQLKKILHALSHVPSNIIEPFKDGIGETYAFVNKNLKENSTNTLVFLRQSAKEVVPASNAVTLSKPTIMVEAASTNNKPKNGSMVLLTAMTLLPELIQIIKD